MKPPDERLPDETARGKRPEQNPPKLVLLSSAPGEQTPPDKASPTLSPPLASRVSPAPPEPEGLESLGRYTLRQSEDCFKLGRDSLLLSRFASLRRAFRVCDLGCGIGTLLLLLSERERDIQRWGVELDPAAAALARENLARNGLEGHILEDDLRRPALLPQNHFHLTISNPPYFPEGSGKSGGPARMEETLTLGQLCAVAGRITRSGGRFALSYRPERLPALFAALEAANFAPKRMRLLSHRPDKPPFAALVEAVKDGRPGLEVLPGHYEE